jgi:hypothetical protein
MSNRRSGARDRRKSIAALSPLESDVARKLLTWNILLGGGAFALGFLAAQVLHVSEGGGGPSAAGLSLVALPCALLGFAMHQAALRTARGVVGPIGKIARALRQVRHGYDPGAVTIRRSDCMHEIVGALNGAVESLRVRQGLRPSEIATHYAGKRYLTAQGRPGHATTIAG